MPLSDSQVQTVLAAGGLATLTPPLQQAVVRAVRNMARVPDVVPLTPSSRSRRLLLTSQTPSELMIRTPVPFLVYAVSGDFYSPDPNDQAQLVDIELASPGGTRILGDGVQGLVLNALCKDEPRWLPVPQLIMPGADWRLEARPRTLGAGPGVAFAVVNLWGIALEGCA